MQNNGAEAAGGLARRRDRRLLPLFALTVALALLSACGGAAEERRGRGDLVRTPPRS